MSTLTRAGFLLRNSIREGCLAMLAAAGVALPEAVASQVPPVTMVRDAAAIEWTGGAPRSSEYKDVQTARDPDGTLLLYLPLTRPTGGVQADALYAFDPAAGKFVDRTAALLPFLNTAIDRGTYDADFVDIDRDADFDIVHSSPHGTRIYVNRRNEASAAFADETGSRLPALLTEDAKNIWDDVTAGDVDGDGDLDLMFSNRNFPLHADPDSNWGPNVLVYNDGSGRFGLNDATRELFGLPTTVAGGGTKLQGASHGSKFADLDNDGRLDLIISHESNFTTGSAAPDFEILLNRGDANADGRVDWAITPVTQSGKIVNVGVFDFDADGDLDLYFARIGSNDEILLGRGDGTFDAPLSVSSMSGGVNDVSYDVAFGDFNNDERIDIVVVDADGTSRVNHLYLNDHGNPSPTARLVVSNEPEFNPSTAPFSTLTAQPVDHDSDGDLDVVLGADARSAGNTPIVIRNDLGARDAHAPEIERPALVLSASRIPSALFRIRVRDRAVDFDEISADLDWATTGAGGGSANGTSALAWAAQMTYQAVVPCTALRGGSFSSGEALSGFTWTVRARDANTNSSSLASSAAGMPNLLAQLANSVTLAGLGIDILEPLGSGAAPIVPDDGTGRLLVRVALKPAGLVPNLDEFDVRINGAPAAVLAVRKVGDQAWLAVQPPPGPGGVHDLEVRYGVCGLSAISSTERNAVAYDDNPAATDAVLVVDTSGSMNSDDRLAAAINAGSLFVNTLRDADRIGVVRYSGSSAPGASSVFALTSAATGRSNAITALSGVTASGCTPLGSGLLQGLSELDNLGGEASNPLRALLLLSDGLENVAPFWDSPPIGRCSSAAVGAPVVNSFLSLNTDSDPANDVRVDTVALGPNASVPLMAAIAASTNGIPRQVLQTAGTMVAYQPTHPLQDLLFPVAYAQAAPSAGSLQNQLADTYEHLHNHVSRQDRIWRATDVSKAGTLALPGQFDEQLRAAQTTQGRTIDIPMPANLRFATISVNWATPREIAPVVVPPPGQNPAAIQTSRAPTNSVFKVSNPAAGVWRVVLPTRETFEAMALLSGESSTTAFARALLPQEQTHVGELPIAREGMLPPGTAIPISLMLIGSAPISGATVRGRASSFGHGVEDFSLLDDGLGSDSAAGDGVYTGVVSRTERGGALNIEITSSWTEPSGPQTRITPLSVALTELDSDRDSLSDNIERWFDLDPTNPRDAVADIDRDGLATWREIMLSLDPRKRDTDGGGVSDGDEVRALSDPEDAGDDRDALTDDDRDGLPSKWEVGWGLDPNSASDARDDRDGDGLDNLGEYANGSSPTRWDSDGDGRSDGDEVAAGADPSDPLNRAESLPGGDQPESSRLLGVLCALLAILLILALFWIWRQRRGAAPI